MGKNYSHTVKRHSSFEDRYVVSDNGCWEWKGAIDALGYGHTWADGKATRAHRYSYVRSFGPIPDGLCVCHRCDNRKCVNPDHLFLGTRRDNVYDMLDKGRARPQKGEDNGRAKLSASDVMAIRALYSAGDVTFEDLSSRYGVSKSAINDIISHKRWRDIGAAAQRKGKGNVTPRTAKASPKIAADIRRRFAAGGVTQRQLAQEYGLSSATICRIVNGDAWKSKA